VSYLLDANIWLERMLDQERSADVAELLAIAPSDQLCMTDFTLHSIGVILRRLKRHQTYFQSVQDVLVDGVTQLLTLPPEAMSELVKIAVELNLDFNDAYQYAAAMRHDLTIVSLDADFDHTQRGRRTPREVLRALDAAIQDD